MKLNRRHVLRGLGAGALAFPFLGDTRAWSATGAAKRLIVFFSGTGMEMKAWKCAGGESGFTFSRTLKPLATTCSFYKA